MRKQVVVRDYSPEALFLEIHNTSHYTLTPVDGDYVHCLRIQCHLSQPKINVTSLSCTPSSSDPQTTVMKALYQLGDA